MRCPGPAAVEEVRQHRVCGAGRDQPGRPVGMHVGLRRGQEPRADHRPRRAGCHRGLDTARIGDASGGDDRDRKRARELADQRQDTDLALHVPPPASTPWATTTSQPASTAACASAGDPAWTATVAPAAWARAVRRASAPHENEISSTPSARATSRRSSCSNASTRLTQTGRSVILRISRICERRRLPARPTKPQRPEPSRLRNGGRQRRSGGRADRGPACPAPAREVPSPSALPHADRIPPALRRRGHARPPGRKLGAVSDADLAVDPRQVRLDRLLAHPERARRSPCCACPPTQGSRPRARRA